MMECMKTGIFGGLRRLSLGVAVCALGAMVSAAPAQAREFVESAITLDLSSSQFDAEFTFGGKTTKVTSPRQIADKTFTKFDLRVKLPDEVVAERLMRKVDESYEPEPSGCRPGNYEALAMEDGLRYFFEVDVPKDGGGTEKVSAVFFPGDRSDHFANDVFCEYDEALGEKGAVFRLTGFFYVIHRKTQVGWDVQLRAVRLTEKELESQF